LNAYWLNPQEKMLNYLLGHLEVEAGNFKEAEFYLNREIAISQIPDNYFNLALVYFNKSNFDSAVWCLERVIELSPLHPQANHNLSLLYMQLNRKADAAKLIDAMKQKGLEVPAELKNLPQ
jgi:tetratricopeptide (TPR) repeat protein